MKVNEPKASDEIFASLGVERAVPIYKDFGNCRTSERTFRLADGIKLSTFCRGSNLLARMTDT